jgi:hypothetical protein
LGVLAARWTRMFAGIVGISLLGISVYDIAVRDIVMAISAFCLARLSAVVPSHATERSRPMKMAPAQ